MRAWRVHAWGEPETMTLDEIEKPETPQGHVRIRNHAAALNFFDVLQIQGKYQVKPPFPFIPGAEVAGIVESVGSGVEGFKAGDRVMAMPRGNGFAEFTVAKSAGVFPIPDRMSFEEGSAMLIPYHT